jgi:hypothetical protein
MIYWVPSLMLSLFLSVAALGQTDFSVPIDSTEKMTHDSIESNGPQGSDPLPDRTSPNSFFLHPTITVISMLVDEIPLVLCGTFEHPLQGSKSFIWQQQIMVGEIEDKFSDIKIYNAATYLGLRNYFLARQHSGWYVQGSLAAAFGRIQATEKQVLPTEVAEEASAIITAFGALAYIGHKSRYMFIDLGAGYQTAGGTIKSSSGQEIQLAVSGLAMDLNLGFGF